MPSFLTFTLVNLKYQLIQLAREEQAHPERRESIQGARMALELALKNAILRHCAEQESPNATKH